VAGVAEVVGVEVALLPEVAVAVADETMEKVKDLSIQLFVGNVQMVIGTMRQKACKVTLDLTPVDGEEIIIEVGAKGKVGADMRVREDMAVEVETTVKGIMKLVVGEDETKEPRLNLESLKLFALRAGQWSTISVLIRKRNRKRKASYCPMEQFVCRKRGKAATRVIISHVPRFRPNWKSAKMMLSRNSQIV
jgi:hypothetical protein